MKAYFSTLKKRKNSTKQPSRVGAAERDVKLKDNCSLHNPVLLFNSPSRKWTYCELDDGATTPWIGYFFISDMVQVANDLWEIYLECDPMAEARTDIGNSIFHVAFASMFTNKTIPDPRIAVQTTKNITGSTSGQILNATGCYIFTVLNNESNGVGCATSYALNQDGMDKVKQWLSDDSVYAALTNFFNDTPMSAVFACTWIPFSLTDVPGTAVTDLKFGNRTLNGDHYYIATGDAKRVSGFAVISGTANVSCHLRYPVTDFRAVEPYTSGTIYLPGIGNIDLNMSDWINSTKINVSYTFEVVTGNMEYLLFTDNGALVQSASCNIASQCPLGQITMNSNGMVSGIGTAVAAGVALFATGGVGMAGAAAAGAMLSGAANTVLSYNKRSPSISGAAGGRIAALWPYIDHIEYAVDTEDPDDLNYIAERGRPLGEMKTISTLAGYVQCEGASLHSDSVFADDYDTINNYLNSGFFYE